MSVVTVTYCQSVLKIRTTTSLEREQLVVRYFQEYFVQHVAEDAVERLFCVRYNFLVEHLPEAVDEGKGGRACKHHKQRFKRGAQNVRVR